jgi:hypothetical protein
VAAALTMVEARWRREAKQLALQVCADLQVGIDRFRQTKPEVWVLAVSERAPTTFGSIVRRLPCGIPQECAEPCEVVRIQVLLLTSQRR